MKLKLLLLFFLATLFSCSQTDSIAKYRKLKRLTSEDVLERAKYKQLNYHYAKFKNVHGEDLNEAEKDQLNEGQLAKDYYINKKGEIVEVRVRPISMEDKFLEIQVRSLASYTSQDSLLVAIDCDSLTDIVKDMITRRALSQMDPDDYNGLSEEDMRQAHFDKMTPMREKNQQLAESILRYCDFPDQTQIGDENMDIFLSVLRNLNMGLMAYYFEKIKIAADNGKLDKKNFAVIQDRLLMLNGYKQIYGSQVMRGRLHRIEEPETVNERRAAVGLRPIEEYLESQGINFEEELKQMNES